MVRVKLRKAESEDSQDIFDWRNDPVTVKYSISGEVKLEDHHQWYKRKIEDKETLFLVMTDSSDKRFGMIRFDQKPEHSIININLSPSHRSLGLGKIGLHKALKYYFDKYSQKPIIATVHKDNIPSQSLFSKFGFEKFSEDEEFYNFILTKETDEKLRIKFGIKIWSINHQWFADLIKAYKEGEFDFVELYAVPGTFDPDKLSILRDSGLPINIHAPNEHQLNLAKDSSSNIDIFKEVVKFANFFDSEYIIIHCGTGDDETMLQNNLDKISDQRIVIENVPHKSLIGDEPLFAYSFERVDNLLKKNCFSFCLDFGHAIKSAKSQGIDQLTFLKRLLSLRPKVFHLNDGSIDEEKDEHLNLGAGGYDINIIKRLIKNSSTRMLVFETPKNGGIENDFINMDFFRGL